MRSNNSTLVRRFRRYAVPGVVFALVVVCVCFLLFGFAYSHVFPSAKRTPSMPSQSPTPVAFFGTPTATEGSYTPAPTLTPAPTTVSLPPLALPKSTRLAMPEWGTPVALVDPQRNGNALMVNGAMEWKQRDGGLEGDYFFLKKEIDSSNQKVLATWHFRFPQAVSGLYEIWAFWPAHSRVASRMTYRVVTKPNDKTLRPLVGFPEKSFPRFPDGKWLARAKWESLGIYRWNGVKEVTVSLASAGKIPSYLPVDAILISAIPSPPDLPLIRQKFAGEEIFFWVDDESAHLMPDPSLWTSFPAEWDNWNGSHLLDVGKFPQGRAAWVFPQPILAGNYELCVWIPGNTEDPATMLFSIYLNGVPAAPPAWRFYVLGHPQPLSAYQVILKPEEGYWNKQCLGRLTLADDETLKVTVSPVAPKKGEELVVDAVILVHK